MNTRRTLRGHARYFLIGYAVPWALALLLTGIVLIVFIPGFAICLLAAGAAWCAYVFCEEEFAHRPLRCQMRLAILRKAVGQTPQHVIDTLRAEPQFSAFFGILDGRVPASTIEDVKVPWVHLRTFNTGIEYELRLVSELFYLDGISRRQAMDGAGLARRIEEHPLLAFGQRVVEVSQTEDAEYVTS